MRISDWSSYVCSSDLEDSIGCAVEVAPIQCARHSTSHALSLPGLTRQPIEPLASSLRAGRWTRVSSPRVTTGGVACEPLPPPVPRLRRGAEVCEEIEDQPVVLLLDTRVRDAGHAGELLSSDQRRVRSEWVYSF